MAARPCLSPRRQVPLCGADHPAQEGRSPPQAARQGSAAWASGHIKADDRSEPVFVIVGIEQPQLLTAVPTSKVSSRSITIRLGACRKDAQYRSIIARPIRSSNRASGRFSRRERVGCEHSARSRREVERHLEQGIAPQVQRALRPVAGRDTRRKEMSSGRLGWQI